MNCSVFDRELDRLVETRGGSLPDSVLAHAAECAACGQRWRDHRLIETALTAWRPVQYPSLVESVLTELAQDHSSRVAPRPGATGSRWMAVAVAAACVMIVLGLGLASRPDSNRLVVVHDTGRKVAPMTTQPRIEVASSVAAVLDDLHAEYRVLAAETSATARELAVVLPATSRAPWDEALTAVSMQTETNQTPNNAKEEPSGAVSLIGRSFGNQIGQAMDFLRAAVPDEVPRG